MGLGMDLYSSSLLVVESLDFRSSSKFIFVRTTLTGITLSKDLL
jgi:hypothetical protein